MTGKLPRKEHRATERFQDMPVLSRLTPDEVERLLACGDEVVLPAGKPVFQPGEPADSMYIILSGKVDVGRPPPGRPLTVLATVGQGSVIGGGSCLNQRPRSAGAFAVEETRLHRIDGARFRALLDKGDVAGFKFVHEFAKLLSGRLRRLEDELVKTLEGVAPEQREQRLRELQQFRQTLYSDWSF